MRKRALIILLILLALMAGATQASAQQQGEEYQGESDLYPRESDVKTYKWGKDTAKKPKSQDEPGKSIGADFESKGPNYKHPWKNGNSQSQIDWMKDSFEAIVGDFDRFEDCLDVKAIKPSCPYCQPKAGFFIDDDCYIPMMNNGVVFEYWWPEYEVEINNFGVSSINPVEFGKAQYLKSALSAQMQTQMRAKFENYRRKFSLGAPAQLPSGLTRGSNAGNSHHDGLTAPDQTQVAEAHTYLSEVQSRISKARGKGEGTCETVYIRVYNLCIPAGDFWFNGFQYGSPDKCFYDTLDPEEDSRADTIKAWTEDPKYAEYWRIQEKSKEINEDFYKVSVPFELGATPQQNFEKIKTSKYAKEKSCSAYRIKEWEDIYGDLQDLLGIKKAEKDEDVEHLDVICYKGGDQLYPLVGTLTNQHNPLVAAAFLARRAIELIGQIGDDHLEEKNKKNQNNNNQNGQGESYWDKHKGEHVNKFTRITRDSSQWSDNFKEVDKLQRVFPDASRCFRMSEVDERDKELFPPDLVRPDDNGSIRYIVWNKRTVCSCEMRGIFSAEEEDAGSDSCTAPWWKPYFDPMDGKMGMIDNKGWGCQLYPREEDQLDLARGNVEEDEIKGTTKILDGYMTALMVPLCVYPFVEGLPGCDLGMGGGGE